MKINKYLVLEIYKVKCPRRPTTKIRSMTTPTVGFKSTNHPMEACPSSPTPPSSSMETPTSVITKSSPSFIFLDNDPIPHPVRPDKPVCPLYKYYGSCGSGALCLFDHPEGLQPLYAHKKKGKRGKNQLRTLRAFTSDQRKAHMKRAHETEGFHVGYVPLGSRLNGMIAPIPLSECGTTEKNLAKLAIKGYNEVHDTTYKFVKLIRVNIQPLSGVLYYITFQAKDGKLGSRPQNFQSRVFKQFEKTEVQLCRLEQKKSTLPEGPGETSQKQGQ